MEAPFSLSRYDYKVLGGNAGVFDSDIVAADNPAYSDSGSGSEFQGFAFSGSMLHCRSLYRGLHWLERNDSGVEVPFWNLEIDMEVKKEWQVLKLINGPDCR